MLRTLTALRRNPYVGALIGALVLLPILTPVFLRNLDDLSTFNGDETLWLPVSDKLFRLYVVEHDFQAPAWRDEYATFGSRQPQVGKYIIGIGTYLGGWVGEPYMAYYYDWSHDLSWNMANKGVPPAELVRAGRVPVAIMGLVACLALYWLATLLTDVWVGLLSVALFVGGRLVVTTSRLTMIDAPALAFSLLTLIGMVYVLRALRQGRSRAALCYIVPTGLVAGLAVGTKLNALLVLGACVAMLLGETLSRLQRQRRLALLALLLLTLLLGCAWLVFYASNPFLYGNAVAGSRHLLAMGSIVATIPIEQLTTRRAQVEAIWGHLLTYAPLARLNLPYDRWLILLGAALVGALAVGQWEQLRRRTLDLVLVWTALAYLGITLWLPHAWERYYLPLQPCNALLEAIAISSTLRWLWSLVTTTWSMPRPHPQTRG